MREEVEEVWEDKQVWRLLKDGSDGIVTLPHRNEPCGQMGYILSTIPPLLQSRRGPGKKGAGRREK